MAYQMGMNTPQIQYGSTVPGKHSGQGLEAEAGNIIHKTAMWGARIAAGKAGDTAYHHIADDKAGSGAIKTAGSVKSISYGDWLGFNGEKPKFNMKDYASKTLWGNNVEGLADWKNNPGTAAAKGLGIGLLGLGVASDTYQGYQNAKAEHGDDNLAVAGDTAMVFGGSAVKAGVSWEVSNLLYDVGKSKLSSLTVGRVPLGGIVLGAAGAVMTSHALDKVIPKPGHKSANPDKTYDQVHKAIDTGNPFDGNSVADLDSSASAQPA